jgi:hypothetical protein
MTRKGLTTLALTAAAVLTTSGCGGTKGLSRAELIAKADPLCRRANTTIDSSKLTPKTVSRLAPGIAAVEQEVSSQLAKLTPPSSMASDWKTIVNGFRSAGTGLLHMGEARKTNDTHALVKAEAELSNGQIARTEAAQRNGFKDCSHY